MQNERKIIGNPLLVLREEFDDWAILFDPDTGNSYGLDPVAVYIWKHLDGQHTLKDIMAKLRGECNNAPDDAESYVSTFIDDLLEKGLAGYELKSE